MKRDQEIPTENPPSHEWYASRYTASRNPSDDTIVALTYVSIL